MNDRMARLFSYKTGWHIISPALIIFSIIIGNGIALADQPDCLMCHAQLTKEKTVHPALHMGCPTCHTAIDASDIPHKKKNKLARGLSSDQPGLCYGCHDKAKFTKKNVHAALGMGCTTCHNPHSSGNPKLLSSPLPDLCLSCHDKTAFSGKASVHPPVAGGMCTGCHNPHSSDVQKLLLSEPPDLCYNCHERDKFFGRVIHAPVGIGMCTSCHSPHQSDNEKLLSAKPPDLCFNCHDKSIFAKQNVHPPVMAGMCLQCHSPHMSGEFSLLVRDAVNLCFGCHSDVRKKPHAVVAFQSDGHPLGIQKKGKKQIDDPARPGKRFYCGSCHDPHSSKSMKLFRYETKTSMGLCLNCHKM